MKMKVNKIFLKIKDKQSTTKISSNYRVKKKPQLQSLIHNMKKNSNLTQN